MRTEDNAEGINSEETVWVAPGNVGYYADGTQTGSAHPGGNYSGNTAELASETAFDGWVVFDNDFPRRRDHCGQPCGGHRRLHHQLLG